MQYLNLKAFLFLSIISMILLNATPSKADLNDDLLAYYPFIANSNDVSGNGNNLTTSGATLCEDRFGYSNSAYCFDGANDYIRANNSTIGNLDDYATISFWFKADQSDLDGNEHRIIEKDNKMYWIFMIRGDGKLYLTLHKYDYYGGPETAIKILDTIPVNTWTFVAEVKSGTTYEIYINGSLVSSNVTDVSSIVTDAPLTIGYSQYWGSQYFRGAVDDIRIYNRALSQAEVSQLYQTAASVPAISLTGLGILILGLVILVCRKHKGAGPSTAR